MKEVLWGLGLVVLTMIAAASLAVYFQHRLSVDHILSANTRKTLSSETNGLEPAPETRDNAIELSDPGINAGADPASYHTPFSNDPAFQVTRLTSEPNKELYLVEHSSGGRALYGNGPALFGHAAEKDKFYTVLLYETETVVNAEDLPPRINYQDHRTYQTKVVKPFEASLGYQMVEFNEDNSLPQMYYLASEGCLQSLPDEGGCEVGVFSNPLNITPGRLTTAVGPDHMFSSLAGLYPLGPDRLLVHSGRSEEGTVVIQYGVWNTKEPSFNVISEYERNDCSPATLSLGSSTYEFAADANGGSVLGKQIAELTPFAEESYFSNRTVVAKRLFPTNPADATAPWLVLFDLGCSGYDGSLATAYYAFDPTDRSLIYLNKLYHAIPQ